MRNKDIKRLYLTLGIESEETPLDPALDVEPEDTDSATAIDNFDDLKDAEKETTELDNFTDSTEAASDLEIAVESALASGRGLTRIEAASLNLALKACMGKYVTVENNLVPGTESYDVGPYTGGKEIGNKVGQYTGGNKSHSQGAAKPDDGNTENNTEQTKTAKKGIKESIKVFIQAIIKKIKGIIHAMKGFFKKFNDRLFWVKGKLKKIIDEMKKTEYFGEFKVKYNVANIHMDGKYNTDDFIDGLMLVGSAFRQLSSGKFEDSSDEEKKFLLDGVAALKESGGEKWNQVRTALRAYLATGFASMLENKTIKGEEGEVTSAPLPGGYRLVFSPGSDQGMKQLPMISFTRKDKLEGDPEQEILLPNRDLLNGIISVASGIYGTYEMTKKVTDATMHTYDEVIRQIDKKYKPEQEAEVENDKDRLASISNYAANATAFRSRFYYFGLDMISTAVQMAEIALKKAAEEKAGKEDTSKKEEKTA